MTTPRKFPTLLDFACPHSGCGARRGIRCIYAGWRFGHPTRQQRVVEAIDRQLDQITTPFDPYRAALETHRELVTGAMRWVTPDVVPLGAAVTGADITAMAGWAVAG